MDIALLIRRTLAVFALAFIANAHASFPATTEYLYNARSGWHPTPAAACQAELAIAGPLYAFDRIELLACYYRYNGGASSFFGNANTRTVCPSNSTLAGGQCTCAAPTYVQDGNACISVQDSQNKNCKALADGLNILGAPMVHHGSPGVTACFGGYVIKGSGGAGGSIGGVASQSELYGPFACSGENASACSVIPKPTAITATCAPGSFPGDVNGVQVCIPPSSTVQAPKTTTSQPPAAGGTAPPLPGAPPGTVESSEQTTCAKGTCTTTTTNKDGTGASTGTTVKTESQGEFCARSPESAGCDKKSDSTFSGSCSGGFVGTGDALQKAVAEAVNKTKCLLDPGTALDGTVSALAAGTFGPELTNASRAIGQFDQSNPLGATCPADMTISVMSASVTIPFSQVCWALQALGYIAVTFTLLYSTIFVVKGF
ncbi:MAG: hypothetical protein Q8O29_08560 [Polaromonas sp.]|uniref:hypothetical protein n=1 Tax=Polaromonas sp. TaxID=1869339 RepID=UPI002732997F|nr:hypothetical protein [Polaromonas sp.]MDP2818317.1 hypothetical protein [Polaromonas sp.]